MFGSVEKSDRVKSVTLFDHLSYGRGIAGARSPTGAEGQSVAERDLMCELAILVESPLESRWDFVDPQGIVAG